MPDSIHNSKLNESLLNDQLSGRQLFVFDRIDSTNQFLLNQAKKLSQGALCLSEQQSAGRGRRGRVWYSPPVGNIYLSQFFHYQGKLSQVASLSLVVGIAIAETLTSFALTNIKLKWPNDLHWHNKKLGGILLETVPIKANEFGIVVGVGVNFAMQPNTQTAQISQDWVSLCQIATTPLNKTELVIKLVQNIEQAITLYTEQGMQPFVAKWQRFDGYYNQEVRVIMDDNEVVGIAKGINEHGALLLAVEDKLLSFHSGEVSLRLV